MEKLLIFIKHHLGFIWGIIDWGNGLLYSCLYKARIERVLPEVFYEFSVSPFIYRKLASSDMETLYNLITSQSKDDLKYFNPHKFDIITLQAQSRKPAFLMMGVFDGQIMVGYFFLRLFANRKCFVGRLIDKDFRSKGIGLVMNNIMYETAWRMGFRCLSTISRNNTAVIRAHAKNPTMIVLKELQNDYMLVEFVRENR